MNDDHAQCYISYHYHRAPPDVVLQRCKTAGCQGEYVLQDVVRTEYVDGGWRRIYFIDHV